MSRQVEIATHAVCEITNVIENQLHDVQAVVVAVVTHGVPVCLLVL